MAWTPANPWVSRLHQGISSKSQKRRWNCSLSGHPIQTQRGISWRKPHSFTLRGTSHQKSSHLWSINSQIFLQPSADCSEARAHLVMHAGKSSIQRVMFITVLQISLLSQWKRIAITVPSWQAPIVHLSLKLVHQRSTTLSTSPSDSFHQTCERSHHEV